MLQINWSTLLLQILNFVVMAVILWRFFFRSVVRILDERSQRVRTALEEAERKEHEAEALRTKYEEQMASAQEQVITMQQQAQEDIARGKRQVLDETRAEISAMRDKAQTEFGEAHRQALYQHRQALGRLVAGVAHELNNPISVVFGNMHALKRYGERINDYLAETGRHLEPSLHQRLRESHRIDRIEADMGPLIEGTMEGAERISKIVLDLRRYSGIQRESCEPFELSHVVTTAAEWVGKAAREKPDVSYDLPDGLQVSGRQGQVHQILVNLVQNAMDAMEGQRPPRLSIRCRQEGENVSISVHDSGPGIPEQDLKKIFDPFFTTKAVGKGTGLGLYISYGLARDMGGDLRVCNHADGGAVFTLVVPVQGVEHE